MFMTSPLSLFDTITRIESSPLVPSIVYVAASATPAVINKASAIVVNNSATRLMVYSASSSLWREGEDEYPRPSCCTTRTAYTARRDRHIPQMAYLWCCLG